MHFVCESGMSHCVLGTDRENPGNPPPCEACIRQSRHLFADGNVHWFKYSLDADLAADLKELNVQDLSNFECSRIKAPLVTPGRAVPLGSFVLPSIRWALRRHTLNDDEETRQLLRSYILSSYNIAQNFSAFLDEYKPSSVIIFNGTMFPEATARWVVKARGIRVITHEVGFQRFSAFFTDEEATAYPIHIPENFELTEVQNRRLDNYLQDRFKGQFTMAGISFWPEIRQLGDTILEKITHFRQVIPVFTNVVYDTSQVHANTVFPHMFAWLNLVLEIIRANPDTLFVIRAHPDEMRPGTRKISRESVAGWIEQNQVTNLPNVIFIDSQDYISSYEVIKLSKFIMVYNSSIGMEAVLMGIPVLCGGKARYTQYPIVFFPQSIEEYREKAEEFISTSRIELPLEYLKNARQFLYFQLFRTSLSFGKYLEDGGRKGFVHLKPFSWEALLTENSPTLKVLVEGITGKDANHRIIPGYKIENTSSQFLVEDSLS